MLINTEWFYPELFLTISILCILGYAVIYYNKSSILTFNKFLIWLSGLVLILTIPMYIYASSADLVMGSLGANQLITGIKAIVAITALILLFFPRNILIVEYPVIILLTVLGMNIILSSKDFIMLYLGIELLSLSLYILAAIKRNSEYSTEAGLKYFILGAVSSGLYLIGVVILYLITGSTGYTEISITMPVSLNIGAIFIIIALLFKLAAAPFHMWVPDVYEGSPTIITAYFAIVPKIAIIGALILILTGPFVGLWNTLQPLIIISIILSLIIGTMGALNQSKLKRILAYSAIGHMGFILMGLMSATLSGFIASISYILIYIIMSIFSFTFILVLYNNSSTPIVFLTGLSRTHKILSISFALVLMSIAGVPPLAGFLSKLLVLNSAIESGLWVVSIIAILMSTISAFYYLQLIKLMFFNDGNLYSYKILSSAVVGQNTINFSTACILGGSLYLILSLLLYPNPIIGLANELVFTTLI